ncbi:MAG: carboxy-S-adenosyl-L-methionine synthase CmoA [Gammaproteobacteria bacterium]|nr:carboxy-S-adenosyl-L-methionine synthase CmoA [Gammaproteobacteria bacterium]
MTDFSSRDRVFSKPLTDVKAFEFDEQVTRVFDDMISRSVPGYDLLLRLIALYADIFVSNQSQIYDLGCSTGLVSRVIAQQVAERQCVIHAIDNSTAMIDSCRERHAELDIEWQCSDIEAVEINQASMVVLNLTLQFIKPEQRQDLIDRIFDGLLPGGILVLSEKIRFDQPQQQQTMTELYQAFKKLQGYSDLEISQKRSALEQVLIPDSAEQHWQRLQQSGFAQIHECFRGLNFISYLAIKA